MNYLLEYPHGCTEQITSQAFPILYIEQFTALSDEEKERATAKVDEVIRCSPPVSWPMAASCSGTAMPTLRNGQPPMPGTS